jgi:O-antigen ligase
MKRTDANLVRFSRIWFIIGLIGGISLETNIGRIYLADILILIGFFFVRLFRFHSSNNDEIHQLRIILSLIFCWILSQLISDFYRGTDWILSVKYLLNLLIFFICLLIFRRLHQVQLTSMLVGLATFNLVVGFFDQSSFGFAYVWKWSLGLNLAFIVLALVYNHDSFSSIRYNTLLLCLLAGTLISLIASARSLGIIYLTTLTLMFLYRRKFKGLKGFPLSWYLIVWIVMLLGFTTFSKQISLTGALGEGARQKYLQQTSGSAPILFQGRQEFGYVWVKVKESPILGYGAYPTVKSTDVFQAREFLLDIGVNASNPQDFSEGITQIPSHSHFWAAWLSSGILGAICWACIFFLLIRNLRKELRSSNFTSLPLVLFLSSLLIWDILFSPFGAYRRFFSPLALTILLRSKSKLTQFRN